jgi:hypothetical protein
MVKRPGEDLASQQQRQRFKKMITSTRNILGVCLKSAHIEGHRTIAAEALFTAVWDEISIAFWLYSESTKTTRFKGRPS